MQKVMVSRFAGKCRKCRTPISPGTRVTWLGHKHGVTCYPSCDERQPENETPRDEPAPEIPKQETPLPPIKKVERETEVTTFEWSELKSFYANDKHPELTRSANREWWNRFVPKWEKNDGSSTQGGTGCKRSEMKTWLQSGFHVEGLNSPPGDLMPNRERRRMLFTEDGELQVDLALSGFDYPFLEWERRERKPGMRVNVQLNFASIVDQREINKYQLWVARLLYTLEEIGYDLEVNVAFKGSHLFGGNPDKVKAVLIRVKGENEASDFSQWSALFSPGGWRHLGFTSILMANDRHGTDIFYGVNRNHDSPWGISFDSETRTMEITCDAMGSRPFPEGEMTERFQGIMQGNQ